MGGKLWCALCGIELLPQEVQEVAGLMLCDVCTPKVKARPDIVKVLLQLRDAVKELEQLVG